MTHLRQQMIDAMHQRGFSDRTHQSYLAAVRDLAKHYHKPPDQIAQPQIQQYFDYLVNGHTAILSNSWRCIMNKAANVQRVLQQHFNAYSHSHKLDGQRHQSKDHT